MCLLTVAANAHDDYPLIVLHNRDEYFQRSTTPLRLRDDVLCATDQISGGTWMGLNVRTGQFAALTNVRANMGPSASRGELVFRMLRGDQAAASSDEYKCYNLLHGNIAVTGGKKAVSLRLTVSIPPDGSPRTLEPMLQIPPISAPATAPSVSDGPSAADSQRLRCIIAKSNDTGGRWTTSSSSPDDACTWPKAAWMRAEVERLLVDEEDNRALRGETGARDLLKALALPMSATSLPPPYSSRAASWIPMAHNPLPTGIERLLQQAPFIEKFELQLPGDPSASDAPGASYAYGTVSQTVVIQCRSEACIFYAYRETQTGSNHGSNLDHEWTWWRVEVPLSEDGFKTLINMRCT